MPNDWLERPTEAILLPCIRLKGPIENCLSLVVRAPERAHKAKTEVHSHSVARAHGSQDRGAESGVSRHPTRTARHPLVR